MNYQKIYDSIIFSALSRPVPDEYCEKHHILPKSMGGSDTKENIAILTAREHFLAHWLLKKIHNNSQCIYAFHAMTMPVGNGRTRYTSHSFKYAREAMAAFLSETRSGSGHPLFGLRGRASPNFGSKRSNECKAKLSEYASMRKGADHPLSKKIVCLETQEVFASISCARKKHPKGNISYALRTGGTAGGFTFAYFNATKNEKLKGYPSGRTHLLSCPVSDDLGNVFSCISDAAKSIGVTPSAIYAAIKGNRSCKGRTFRRV